MNTPLTAQARISIQDPASMLDILCDHLASHGATHQRNGDRHRVRFPFGTALIAGYPDRVEVEVQGRDLEAIFNLRSVVAGHMQEFSPVPLSILWTGDGAKLKHPPNWRELRVTAITDLTPRMRRVRFAADDLAMFSGIAHIHVRLVFSADGDQLIRPELGPDGLERWPAEPEPAFRRYTIRKIGADWLDIDFVLHAEAEGPGSRFAEAARIGDRLGMLGPGGGSLPLDRDWYLIAGDETALPAIARFMELLPETARGHVVISIRDRAERQDLTLRPGIEVVWVHQGLAQITRANLPPTDATSPYVWVGCEDADFRDLRAFVRKELALPKGSHNIVSYWREGHAAN